MGTYTHKTIICRANDLAELTEAHEAAVKAFKTAFAGDSFDGSIVVSPILQTGINAECSFYVAPDGSSNGSDTHLAAQEARQELINYLKGTDIDWALLHFGGDTAPDSELVDHNNKYDY